MIAIVGNILLFTLVFGMSATVDVSSIVRQFHNTNALMVGMICQFIITPILGCIIVNLLSLPIAQGLTLIIITSSPGGSYSNWWCSLFNTDLALSVTMTAVSTLLSVIFLPINLIIYTKLSYYNDENNTYILQNFNWGSLFISLSIVIGAILLGLYCSYRFHSRIFNQIANGIGNLSGLTLIVMSAVMANSGGDGNNNNDNTKIWNQHWTFYVGTIFPCFGALIIATLFSYMYGLLKPECITVGIEACYQNVGIATSLVLTMFEGDELREAMGIPFFYGIVEAVLVGIYCLIAWKTNWTKAPSDAPFWQILITSYEVLAAAANDDDINEIEINMSDSGCVDSDKSTTTPTTTMEHYDGNILTTYFAWLDPTILTPNQNHQQNLLSNENNATEQQSSQQQNRGSESEQKSSYISPTLGHGEV
jgi:predicted Na+-dependent transporter